MARIVVSRPILRLVFLAIPALGLSPSEPLFSRRSLCGTLLAAGALQAPAVPAVAATAPLSIAGGRVLRVSAERVTAADLPAALADLCTAGIVLCGEHHNSRADHALELELLRTMADAAERDRQPLTLGLEMFERRFQPVLDAYSAGELSDEELFERSEWRDRWVWPYEAYLPIWREARDRGVKMVALNTDTEVLLPVPISGLESLPAGARRDLVPDPVGFVEATRAPHFKRYTDLVIMASFGLHLSQEFIDKRATPQGFFAARILRDEAMAARMAAATRQNGGRGLLLAGSDHCKFELGIAQRLRRCAGKGTSVRVVLLNPSPSDTLSSSETQLALRLGSEEDAPLLADYVVYTEKVRKVKTGYRPKRVYIA